MCRTCNDFSCFGPGTTGRSADPFQPLLDHLEEHGGWSNDNEKVAKVFHRCVDAIPKDQDKAIIRFVGDNDNRAYWVADYLVEPVYLGGHTRDRTWHWPFGPIPRSDSLP